MSMSFFSRLFEDHPLRPVPALAERLHDPEALQRLLLPLDGVLDLGDGAQLRRQLVQIDLGQEVADGLRAHLRLEGDRLVLRQLVVLVLRQELLLLEAARARIDDDVRLVVQHALQVADRHVQQVADPARDRLEEPDMGNGNGQLDVAQPLATHLGLRHLHAAAVADDPAVADPLVLAAVALPVLDGAEDLLAEEPVPLRLEGAVVDRLRLRHLAMRPAPDGLRRGQHDADGIEADPAPQNVAVLHPR
jgi:hypothetical protein